MTKIVSLLFVSIVLLSCSQQPEESFKTVCNPVDLSYRFQLNEPSRREAADPTMVVYHDKYWLFASKSGGYWYSEDLAAWTFVETKQIPTEDYAPTAVVLRDTLFFLASNPRNKGAVIYKSAHPETGNWQIACAAMDVGRMTDPAIFLDTNGHLYFYWGCSNVNPLYGVEIDPQTFKNIGEIKELYHSNKNRFGWEVFGDYNTLYDDDPWIEGSWMNKFNGKYYLQYAGPGTQWKSYSDAALVSDNPLGPFVLQQHNPFAYKPEGFACGAGHGSTFTDLYGNIWHIGTVTISEKHRFERRLSLFPTFVDSDGTLHAITKYGDYPFIIPQKKINSYDEIFPGWMLLSYGKKVMVSSEMENHRAQNMVDENIRTYWSATSGSDQEWAAVDMGELCEVKAIQLNFAEEGSTLKGRVKGIKHRFTVEASADNKKWTTIIDRSQNNNDNTHVYFQMNEKTKARYIRVNNMEVPEGNFALSGLRVFGKGNGALPAKNKQINAQRGEDRRTITLSWDKVNNATGYVISYGEVKEKLYHNYMVYGSESESIHSLDTEKDYFFTIEAFNENGITKSDLLIEK